MEETLRLHMLELAARYAKSRGINPPTIGKLAINDHNFFSRLRDRKGFTVKTYDRMLAWFSVNWPTDVEWPAFVPRPARTVEIASAA